MGNSGEKDAGSSALTCQYLQRVNEANASSTFTAESEVKSGSIFIVNDY